jgi:hypothetical protein
LANLTYSQVHVFQSPLSFSTLCNLEHIFCSLQHESVIWWWIWASQDAVDALEDFCEEISSMRLKGFTLLQTFCTIDEGEFILPACLSKHRNPVNLDRRTGVVTLPFSYIRGHEDGRLQKVCWAHLMLLFGYLVEDPRGAVAENIGKCQLDRLCTKHSDTYDSDLLNLTGQPTSR